MRMYDVIKKKRDGGTLDREEIEFFARGYASGSVPDYQAAALLMAIFLVGMNDEETILLTKAIAASGDQLDLSGVQGFKVDKHSSGGVGDKTTLVVAPIVAACGVKVAKMSGRGLGHTGGTIDKLEAIPGFQTVLPVSKFVSIVNETGLSIIGQSGELAPADKKLYALRDVTATVDSIPLIASSIMGKKLASADDGIVLDVKVGSGSFNKTLERGRKLAEIMVKIGNAAGKKTVAVLSDMNRPLGATVGNALEVVEAINTLNGKGEPRFLSLCLSLSARMLSVAGLGDAEKCEKLARESLTSGRAIAKFRQMVVAQGGDAKYVDDVSLFDLGMTREVRARNSGYITAIDTEKYGVASLLLGAGRNKKEDNIDAGAGIEVVKNLGDEVQAGDVVAVLHAARESLFDAAENALLSSLEIGSQKPCDTDIVLGVVE